VFEDYNEKTRLEILMCNKMEDVDVKEHISDLKRLELMGNDF